MKNDLVNLDEEKEYVISQFEAMGISRDKIVSSIYNYECPRCDRDLRLGMRKSDNYEVGFCPSKFCSVGEIPLTPFTNRYGRFEVL